MIDEQAIRNLSFHYAELNDRGDWHGVGALLAAGRMIRQRAGATDAVNAGAEEIETFYATHVQLHDGSPGTRHAISNLIVEVEPGGMEARTRSYFTVLQSLPDFPLQIIAAGRYSDRFARRDGVWRYVEKAIRVDFVRDISRHARPIAA